LSLLLSPERQSGAVKFVIGSRFQAVGSSPVCVTNGGDPIGLQDT
jgi:hypothetical protein